MTRLKDISLSALCALLSFLLVFNLAFSFQVAFAADSSQGPTGGAAAVDSTGSGSDSSGSGSTDGATDPGAGTDSDSDTGTNTGATDKSTSPYLAFLSVTYMDDTGENEIELASTEGTETTLGNPLSLTRQGQKVALQQIVMWDDYTTTERPSARNFTFASSNESVATIDADGNITARGDGEAQITVTYIGPAAVEAPLSVTFPVVASNQSAKQITSIQIYEQSYGDVDLITINDQEKDKVYLQFYARVTLQDGSVYDTANGRLSSQDPELADIVWQSFDQFNIIESTTGEYRQGEYGTGGVAAYSSDYKVSSNSITITVNNPDPNSDSEAHPQESLTVHIAYAEAGDESVTIPDKVYTDEDLYSMYTYTETYTLVNESYSAQATGTGVSVRALLTDACALASTDLDAIESVQFLSGADGGNYTTSIANLFATRYTWDPSDYLVGATNNGRVCAEPMLAFESNWLSIQAAADGSEKPMTDSTKYRLLMGSQSTTDRVTGNSIKWINRINITLKGAPPVDPDDPVDPDNPDQPTNPDNPGDGGNNGNGNGNGGQGAGGTGGQGGGNGAGTGSGTAGLGSGNGNGNTQGNDTGDGTGTGDGESGSVGVAGDGSSTGSGYSIYQMINKYRTGLDVEYADNPLRPYVLPVGVASVAAGLVYAAVWYGLQSRRLRFVSAVGHGAPA